MQMTRNWQESFDRLEKSRREEQRMREAEERQIRLAEAAYARASLEAARAEKAASAENNSFMLPDQGPDQAELLVKPESPPKAKVAKAKVAKQPAAKASPRKRAAPRRTARVAKAKATKPRAKKPKAAKPRTAKPSAAVAKLAKPRPATLPLAPAPPLEPAATPAISLLRETPPVALEPLLITPLPRSASLARYNKRGLFGLIGSWLRLAARRPRLPEGLRKASRKKGAPRDDLVALREENEQLRRELEALRAKRAETPPWSTAPAGSTTPEADVPARPRRLGGILG